MFKGGFSLVTRVTHPHMYRYLPSHTHTCTGTYRHTSTHVQVPTVTHPHMYRYLPTDLEIMKAKHVRSSGTMMFANTKPAYENILKWASVCSLDNGVYGPAGPGDKKKCNSLKDVPGWLTCHPTTSPWSMGLLHNLGDGCRHTATAVAAWRSPRRGEIFMTAISSPRRHSSPFGDTHRHLATPIAMATPIAIWRHPSPFGDRRRQGETNRIGL